MASYLSKTDTDIGSVLILMGACEPKHVVAAKAIQEATPTEQRKKLGEMLEDSGEVTAEEVEAALLLQKQMRNGQAIHAAVAINARLAKDVLRKVG